MESAPPVTDLHNEETLCESDKSPSADEETIEVKSKSVVKEKTQTSLYWKKEYEKNFQKLQASQKELSLRKAEVRSTERFLNELYEKIAFIEKRVKISRVRETACQKLEETFKGNITGYMTVVELAKAFYELNDEEFAAFIQKIKATNQHGNATDESSDDNKVVLTHNNQTA